MRELDEDARAVAGVGVRALGAAVLQAVEREQAALHHLVRSGAPQARDERDAAGVVLELRVIETGGRLHGVEVLLGYHAFSERACDGTGD